ncbi:MAG: hypothetical protein IJ265_05735, partial [Oscillospiraceae bacterium]|nr:hypothetical protein [Oscillospiraceae bacterium]
MQHFLMHLKLFYRKNKAIFLLMLMIQIMVACSMHYIFLKTQSSHYEIDAYQQDLKTFTITKTDGWSADEIKESFALLPFSAESAWIYDEQYNVKTYLIGEETELQKAIGHFDCDDFQYSEWQNGAYILRSVQHMYKTNSNPTCKVNDYEVTILGKCDDYLEKHSIIPNTVFE